MSGKAIRHPSNGARSVTGFQDGTRVPTAGTRNCKKTQRAPNLPEDDTFSKPLWCNRRSPGNRFQPSPAGFLPIKRTMTAAQGPVSGIITKLVRIRVLSMLEAVNKILLITESYEMKS